MLFQDIAGQEVIKNKLINNIRNKRVSHAQMFLGAEGSGKLALALAYAQYLNCQNPSETDSCGVCPPCNKFNKLIHPDLHMFFPVANNKDFTKDVNSVTYLSHWRNFVLESPYFGLPDWYSHIGIENKQGVIKADDCNEIIRLMGLKPYESQYKIVIIWMVEKIFHSAAPKLLKIFEEPPDKTLFILIAENQEQILKTILSRAQILKIPSVKEVDVADFLKQKFNTESQLAKKIAFLSAGNMSEAIRLSKEGLEGVDALETFRNWMLDCHSFKVNGILKTVENISKEGREKQKSLIAYGIKMLRLSMLFSMQIKTDSLVRIEGDEKIFLEKFSKFINTSNINEASALFQEAYTHIERNANPKILFTDLSFKMTRLLRSVK
ncbi:MAG: DNA polymerase III subunit delta [Bacteroidetes bacterium]|nr:DNA polymerase III subunit delta [Bacteroidota bacterium]